MAAPKPKKTASPKVQRTTLDQEEKQRLWLMYPAKLITRPVIWELGRLDYHLPGRLRLVTATIVAVAVVALAVTVIR